jgi:hypothetical protein
MFQLKLSPKGSHIYKTMGATDKMNPKGSNIYKMVRAIDMRPLRGRNLTSNHLSLKH